MIVIEATDCICQVSWTNITGGVSIRMKIYVLPNNITHGNIFKVKSTGLSTER